MIWFRPYMVDELNAMRHETMLERLDIVFTQIGDDTLIARMPVDQRTVQPARILHGGASVALAETIGSMGAYMVLDPDRFYCVGLEINANHIRAMQDGFVFGKGQPLHLGRSTQVWEIRITNEKQKLVTISRITMAILPKALLKK